MPFISDLLNFFKANFVAIFIVAATAVVLYFTFFLTATSLKKLKLEIFQSYPFDQFFPSSGKWSVGYFLIVILFLGILIYLLAKGGFTFGPA